MTNTTLTPEQKTELKKIADTVGSQHSAFWIGKENMAALSENFTEGSISYLERLQNLQRGIGNFIQTITGQAIPVTFSSGQQSYTDGKSVVISSSPDPRKLDSMAGLALHEGTHVIRSGALFDFLKNMNTRFMDMVRGTPLLTEAKRLKLEDKTVQQHVQMVMNILEDRAIDLWQYQQAPGYRPYYDALYNEYFYSDEVNEALKNPIQEKSVENYEMFVINMMNENYDAGTLPGLQEIKEIADFSQEGLESRHGDVDNGFKTYRYAFSGSGTPNLNRFPKIFRDSVNIVTKMYQNSTTAQNKKQKPQPSNQDGEGMPSNLPNMDMRQEHVREEIKRQKNFLSGNIAKTGVSTETANNLQQMDDTKATTTEVSGDFLPPGVKAKVIIFRNITKKIVQSPLFPFSYGTNTNEQMKDALKNGIRQGQILAHKIRVMMDEKPLTFNHQLTGRLDKRRIAGLGFGVKDPFAQTFVERTKPANVWLDVDFSGSMAGEKSASAMQVAVAIAYAAQKTRTLNVVIAVRDGSDTCRIAILYDSRKHSFRQLQEILPYLNVGGSTPESLCFEAIREEMAQVFKDERKFFINLSDGMPGHYFSYRGNSYSYGGETASKHCRQIMTEFRAMGIKVLSYFIGAGSYHHDEFQRMYGQDARFIDPRNINQISNTLNKLLLGADK